jgi:hypothetical protein
MKFESGTNGDGRRETTFGRDAVQPAGRYSLRHTQYPAFNPLVLHLDRSNNLREVACCKLARVYLFSVFRGIIRTTTYKTELFP